MKYLFLTSLLASVSAPAFAQSIAAESQPQDEIIVSASRVPLTPREIGSAVTVVTAEQIRTGQILFTKDVLQDIAGVRISSDRPGDFTTVSIRGSDNDQVLFLIDGIELGDPSPITTQFQPENLTTRDIARIEVLRGNQSSLYGSDAIGGVVNITTKRATQEGVTVNAEGEGGSHGAIDGGVSVLGKSGPLDFRVTATGYQHQGPSSADPATGTATERDGYWRYGASGRIGYQVNANIEVQAIGLWQKSDADLDNTNDDSADSVARREYAAALQGKYRSGDGRFRADLTASRYLARRLYFGVYNGPDGDIYRGVKDVASLNLGYDAAPFLRLSAGGGYEREKSHSATAFAGVFDASIRTTSGYVEAALKPVRNLTITGAARIDDNSRFGSFDTYRATAAYLIRGALGEGDVKLRASYGTGAKAPGLYQLFDPNYGNPELSVETSKGGDFGADLNFGDRLQVQLSYFYGKVRNEIVFDGSVPPFGGYLQYGRTRNSGVEAAFMVRPLDWLSITQSYTYLVAEQDNQAAAGQYVDIGRPRNSGTTAITITPDDRLSLTARARYRSRNESSYGGATAGYEVVDLLGSYRLTDTIEVYGRVVNLFDKQYQVSFGGNSLGLSGYGGVRVSF